MFVEVPERAVAVVGDSPAVDKVSHKLRAMRYGRAQSLNASLMADLAGLCPHESHLIHHSVSKGSILHHFAECIRVDCAVVQVNQSLSRHSFERLHVRRTLFSHVDFPVVEKAQVDGEHLGINLWQAKESFFGLLPLPVTNRAEEEGRSADDSLV